MSKASSGRGYSRRSKSTRSLGNIREERTKKVLELQSPVKRSPALAEPNYIGQRNIFISFSMRDQAQVHFLRAQAKDEKNELKFRDYSAKEAFDSKWKTQMKPKMKLCSVTVCMINEDTHTRDAVNWELKTAYKLGHKVVGVRIYRNENHKIPQPLIDNNAPIIDWNLGDLIEQLNTL